MDRVVKWTDLDDLNKSGSLKVEVYRGLML